jgi:hypothetical protein
MLIDGLIEELEIALDDEADDDRRRYYRQTNEGHGGRTQRRRRDWIPWLKAGSRSRLLDPKSAANDDHTESRGLSHHTPHLRRARRRRRGDVVHDPRSGANELLRTPRRR